MTIKRNRGGFRLLSPLVFALLSAIPAKSTFAGSGTIDPSNFAPGQDVSNATPGVVLSTLTLVPTGSDLSVFSAVLSPVYAGVGVYTNSAAFSSSQTGPAEWGGDSAGVVFQATEPLGFSCLNGCVGPRGGAGTTFLEASFATPVSSVSVTEYINVENPAGLQAFNSAGQVIGTCSIAPGSIGINLACYAGAGTSPLNTNPDPAGVFTVTAPDISYILATSYDTSPSQIGEITYVPLPDNFWMLLVGLGGLGCCLLRRRVAIARARPLLT